MRRPSSALARRYARALHDVALAQGADAARGLRDELVAFSSALDQHADLRAALAHPGVTAEARRRLLAAIAEQAGGSPLLRRLVALLAENGRLELLPHVAAAYVEEANAAQGIVAAVAVSAVPLDAAQTKAIAGALGEAVGKRVELATELEPALLGGVLVRVAGRSYDGSVRARLAELRQRLGAES